MLKKSLNQICNIIGGSPSPKAKDFNDRGIPFVKMKDLGRQHVTNNLIEIDNYISLSNPIAQKLKKVPKGSILLPRSGSVALNHRAILGVDAFIVSHICALEVLNKNEVDNKYLFYYLTTINMVKITKKTTGLDAITFEDLGKIKIPLPPLAEQQRIAALLDKADALRRTNRQILDKYDQLAQSVFLEMFGDPVTNPKGWERGTIRKLVSEVKYGTSKKASDTGTYPYLRMNNITYDGYMDYSNLKYIDLEEKEKEKFLVKKGDLLFNRTNSKELVGKTGIYDRDKPMAIAGYLIRVRFNKEANPYYVWGYLNSYFGKAVLQNMCKNIVGMANINAQELQDIKLLIPPISLQNKFAAVIEKIQQQKELAGHGLQKSEELFQSLLQEAFRG